LQDASRLPDGPEFFNRIESKFDVVIDQNGRWFAVGRLRSDSEDYRAWLGTLYLEEKEISMGNGDVGELSNVDVSKTIEAEVEEKCTLPLPQAASSSTTLPSSSQTGSNEAAFVPPLTSVPPNLSVPPCTGSAQGDNGQLPRTLQPVHISGISGNQSNDIPPPMEMSSFEQSFKTFCINKKLNIDLQQLKIDNKPIDLYQLHKNVMLEFGFAMVIDSTLVISLQLIALM
jgi:hypothetical protein